MAQSDTVPPSIWQTWMPFAAIAFGVVGVIRWYNSQSSIADLKDGSYVHYGARDHGAGKGIRGAVERRIALPGHVVNTSIRVCRSVT